MTWWRRLLRLPEKEEAIYVMGFRLDQEDAELYRDMGWPNTSVSVCITPDKITITRRPMSRAVRGAEGAQPLADDKKSRCGSTRYSQDGKTLYTCILECGHLLTHFNGTYWWPNEGYNYGGKKEDEQPLSNTEQKAKMMIPPKQLRQAVAIHQANEQCNDWIYTEDGKYRRVCVYKKGHMGDHTDNYEYWPNGGAQLREGE